MPVVRTYLDYNASVPLLPEARAAMLAAMEQVGNPSSIHAEGRLARGVIEHARRHVAKLVGAQSKSVVFTSGGTEAANLALTPDIAAPGGIKEIDLLLMAAGEHACVLAGHRFAANQAQIIKLDGLGRIDLDDLGHVLARAQGLKVMMALQHANNETGVVQPVAHAAQMVHAHGGIVVCDAVQSAGKIDCDMGRLGADILLLSAHKLGGPKGVGAMITAGDIHIRAPLVRGGGQERGARSGTENVLAIAGFGAAAEAAGRKMVPEQPRMRGLRDRAEGEICAVLPEAVIFGAAAERLPNTLAFAVPGVSAETLLMALDLEGIAVSSGSACSSGKVKRSHVLDAMGIEAYIAEGALRVSFGWANTAEDATIFVSAFEKVLKRARRQKAAA